jgi:hypothetical protein
MRSSIRLNGGCDGSSARPGSCTFTTSTHGGSAKGQPLKLDAPAPA